MKLDNIRDEFLNLRYGEIPEERWQIEIGRLTIAFGLIEQAVNDNLVMLGYSWLYEAVDTLVLDKRCDILRAVMKHHSADERQAANVEALFNAIDRVRGKARNIVAHGAPFLHINPSDGSFEHVVVSPRRTGKRLKLKEVVAAAELAENLIKKLGELSAVARDNLLKERTKHRRSRK
jgi:hypothetical protein